MNTYYEHQKIEKKWQKKWFEEQVFSTNFDSKKKKKYILAMFPYPSGSGLHIGHVRNYTIADVIARYYRFKGYNVFFPIGWDAFGLPAEQYAIKTGNHPAEFTEKNIENFRRQLKSLGFSFDWTREINTSYPEYYKWTQWIFIQMKKNNLVEYRNEPVFWCPELGTVLANEEIIIKNEKRVSERGNYVVEEKKINQWILKITDYAELLSNDLKKIESYWPKSILEQQKWWIGIEKGFLIKVQIIENKKKSNLLKKISVFIKNIDFLNSATALAIAVSFNELNEITSTSEKEKVNNFIDTWKECVLSKEKKTSWAFLGTYAINPINNIKLPVIIINSLINNSKYNACFLTPFFEKENEYKLFNLNHNIISKHIFNKEEIIENLKTDFYISNEQNFLNSFPELKNLKPFFFLENKQESSFLINEKKNLLIKKK